jgi:hypothetical protein
VDRHQECLVPVLKVCCSRYCSWFAETGPAFKFNTENLEGVGWVSALKELGPFVGVRLML